MSGTGLREMKRKGGTRVRALTKCRFQHPRSSQRGSCSRLSGRWHPGTEKKERKKKGDEFEGRERERQMNWEGLGRTEVSERNQLTTGTSRTFLGLMPLTLMLI